MNETQKLIIIFYLIFSFFGFIYSLYKCLKKKDNLGGAHIFNLLGAFVWADAVVFGLFWIVISIATLVLKDWLLFLLIQSVFWTIRSLGEATYWFNQQFSTINRNPGHKLWINKIFKDEYTTWFVYQIQWQCTAVVFIVLSIYLAHIWLMKF